MTEVDSIISQLEKQKAAIERAIEALRGFTTSSSTTPRPARVASKKSNGNVDKPRQGASPLKGRSLSEEQKRAISNAWTPERKQKFAEFHVQRMARERGEDPAKALREYRKRKQKEGGSSAR